MMNEPTPMMNELTEALDRLSRKENFNDPITPEDRLFLRDIDTVCAAVERLRKAFPFKAWSVEKAELEAKLAERRPSPEQWMDTLAENDALREKLEAAEKKKDELYNERHLFVTHAIELKAKLQSAEAQVAKLREALGWYADYENWLRDKLDEIPAMEDHGARARAAIQKDEGEG